MKQIKLFIEKNGDLCEKFNDKVLSSDIGNYIEKECRAVKKKDKVTISIVTPKELTDKEKNDIEELIKNNYQSLKKEQSIVKEYQIKRNLILILLGVIFVMVSNIFEKQFVLSELFLIVGWFAIWEVVDRILFDGVRDKIKTERYNKLIRCKIDFKVEDKS